MPAHSSSVGPLNFEIELYFILFSYTGRDRASLAIVILIMFKKISSSEFKILAKSSFNCPIFAGLDKDMGLLNGNGDTPSCNKISFHRMLHKNSKRISLI